MYASCYAVIVSVKEQVLAAIQRLPDDADFRDVAEKIAFLAAIREGAKGHRREAARHR